MNDGTHPNVKQETRNRYYHINTRSLKERKILRGRTRKPITFYETNEQKIQVTVKVQRRKKYRFRSLVWWCNKVPKIPGIK